MTRLGDGCGTPDYIAPDQIRDARNVDGRADIYSLGCTLYHLLAGQPPFAGGSGYSKVAGHLEGQPKPLTVFRNDLPDELASVISRMTAKDTRDRFGSASEVAEALAPFTDPSPPTTARKHPTRRRWLLTTAGLGLATVCGMFAVHRWLFPKVPVAEEVRCFRGHAGPVQSVAISPDNNFILSGGDDRKLTRLAFMNTLLKKSGIAQEKSVEAFGPVPDAKGRRYIHNALGGRFDHQWWVETFGDFKMKEFFDPFDNKLLKPDGGTFREGIWTYQCQDGPISFLGQVVEADRSPTNRRIVVLYKVGLFEP